AGFGAAVDVGEQGGGIGGVPGERDAIGNRDRAHQRGLHRRREELDVGDENVRVAEPDVCPRRVDAVLVRVEGDVFALVGGEEAAAVGPVAGDVRNALARLQEFG